MSVPAPPATEAKPNLYGLSRAALEESLAALSAPAYHGDQVFRWLYARGTYDPASWTDLPKPLRETLAAVSRVAVPAVALRAEAKDGTVKYRVALPEGGEVESVFMVQRGRVTLCISSQLGCALACDFCLTARMGLTRNLSAGEIAGQVAMIRDDRALRRSPFNVVFMGMGEPLHNYEGVVAAIGLLTDPAGFALSRKRITVSTSGLAPAIERLAGERVRPRLAVSLNATTDSVRDRIMPVNRRYPIDRLLDACRAYARASGEPFTLEYVLLAGVNDGDDDVVRLGALLRRAPAKLNLIPFNPVPGWLPYRATSRARTIAIRDRLLADRLPVSIRWSRGADARAACGQLALLPDAPAGAHRAPEVTP